MKFFPYLFHDGFFRLLLNYDLNLFEVSARVFFLYRCLQFDININKKENKVYIEKAL